MPVRYTQTRRYTSHATVHKTAGAELNGGTHDDNALPQPRVPPSPQTPPPKRPPSPARRPGSPPKRPLSPYRLNGQQRLESGGALLNGVPAAAMAAGSAASAVADLGRELRLNAVDQRRLQAMVQQAYAEGAAAASQHEERHHKVAFPMPLLGMPSVVQRYGQEPQPEVHIGWADLYLDLILVGAAFNGGLLLKHAFYLCEPPVAGGGGDGGDGGVSYGDFVGWDPAGAYGGDSGLGGGDRGGSVGGGVGMGGEASSGEMLLGLNLGLGMGRRLDHRENTHAECVGLGMGVLHVMAFGVPILAAWLKETMFRARFASHNLLSRSLEVLCYLFMIIGASTEEDVQVAATRPGPAPARALGHRTARGSLHRPTHHTHRAHHGPPPCRAGAAARPELLDDLLRVCARHRRRVGRTLRADRVLPPGARRASDGVGAHRAAAARLLRVRRRHAGLAPRVWAGDAVRAHVPRPRGVGECSVSRKKDGGRRAGKTMAPLATAVATHWAAPRPRTCVHARWGRAGCCSTRPPIPPPRARVCPRRCSTHTTRRCSSSRACCCAARSRRCCSSCCSRRCTATGEVGARPRAARAAASSQPTSSSCSTAAPRYSWCCWARACFR